MNQSNPLQNYSAILEIRGKAYRRDMLLIGVLFLLALIGTIALGLLTALTTRSTYLEAALLVGLGFGLITAWVRLEIVKGSLDLLKTLQQALEEK